MQLHTDDGAVWVVVDVPRFPRTEWCVVVAERLGGDLSVWSLGGAVGFEVADAHPSWARRGFDATVHGLAPRAAAASLTDDPARGV